MPTIHKSLDRITDAITGLDNDLAQCRRARTLVERDLAGEKTKQPAQCAWCDRWHDSMGHYVEAPFIAVNVSHGICTGCYREQMAEIKALRINHKPKNL